MEKELGRGTFGKVYLGKYQGEEVAFKKLNISFNSLSKEQLNSIKDELELLKQLKHPNIIKFIDSVQKDNDLLLIIELANAGTLTDYINQHKDQDHNWDLNYQFIANMTAGLKYLHDKGIVHRDLKSMNILINDNIIKITDFGISKVKTFQTKTNVDNVIGTIRWMAPEILNHNQPHTFASDIYSLGMVIWEIASKCTIPFKDVEENFVFACLLRQEREEIPIDIHPVLKQIIQDCWQDKTEQRISLDNIENDKFNDWI